MKKVIRLTERDLTRIVKRVINENEEYLEKIKMLIDNEHFETALQMAETLGLEEKVFDLIVDKIINRDFWMFSDTFYRLVRTSWLYSVDNPKFASTLNHSIKPNVDNPKFASILNAFIKGNPVFKMVLDQIDPNSRQEKYNEIYSKMSEKFRSDSRMINRE